MPFFKTNKIFLESQTVAEQLRRARQEKKLKLNYVAKKLNINYKYLKALEKAEYDKLPAGVYGKNFLREYAVFLGLDYNQLAKTYEQEKNIFAPSQTKDFFSKQVAKGYLFWKVPKTIRIVIIAAVVLIFFIYLAVRLNLIISAPALFIYNPPDNLITKKQSLEINGITEPEANITINGQAILSDAQGNFSKVVNLKSGLNQINITALKKYGRKNIIIKQVLLETDE